MRVAQLDPAGKPFPGDPTTDMIKPIGAYTVEIQQNLAVVHLLNQTFEFDHICVFGIFNRGCFWSVIDDNVFRGWVQGLIPGSVKAENQVPGHIHKGSISRRSLSGMPKSGKREANRQFWYRRCD